MVENLPVVGKPEGIKVLESNSIMLTHLENIANGMNTLTDTINRKGLGGGMATAEFSKIMKEAVTEATKSVSQQMTIGARYEDKEGGITKHFFAQMKKDISEATTTQERQLILTAKLTEEYERSANSVMRFSRGSGDLKGTLDALHGVTDITNDQILNMTTYTKEIGGEMRTLVNEPLADKLLAGREALQGFITKIGPWAVGLGLIGTLAEGSLKPLRENLKVMNETQGSVSTLAWGADQMFGGFAGRMEKSMYNLYRADEETTRKRIASLQRAGVGMQLPEGEKRNKMLEDATENITMFTTRYNVSGETVGKVAEMLAVRVGLSTEDMNNAMAKMIQLQKNSGMSMEKYMATIVAINDATMQYGMTQKSAEVGLGAYSEMLVKGTASIGQVVGMMSPEKMGLGQQMFLAQKMGIQQGTPQEMIGALQQMRTDKPGEFMSKMSEVLLSIGDERSRILNAGLFAKAFNLALPDTISKLNEFLQKGLKASDQEAKQMEDYAKLESYKSKAKADVAGNMGMVDALKVGLSNVWWGIGEIAKNTDPVKVATSSGAEIYKQILQRDTMINDRFKEYGVKGGKAGGGGVSEDGLYRLHAGENVLAPGQGGSGVISFAPGSIVINGSGDLESDLDNAFRKVKAEILDEVKSNWRDAQSMR